MGKSKKKSIIFVSSDEKADWCVRSEGRALYPRYELVDEFRRHSEGQTFHLVKFSYFLELFGASEKVIKQVQQEENLLQTQGNIKKVGATRGTAMTKQSVLHQRLAENQYKIHALRKELSEILPEYDRLRDFEHRYSRTPEEEEVRARLYQVTEQMQILQGQLKHLEEEHPMMLRELQEVNAFLGELPLQDS